MTLGQRLRKLRLAKGMTQAELARPKYTHAYVSSIESGRRKPTRQTLEFLAAKLGVDPEELRTGRPHGLPQKLQMDLHNARLALSSGRYKEAEELLEKTHRQAARFDLTRLQARALEVQAASREHQGKLEQAVELYERAEDLLRGEPLNLRAYAVAGKARCFHMMGDLQYAAYLLESTRERLEQEGMPDPAALVRLNAQLVTVYFDLGWKERAAAAGSAAVRLASKVDDPSTLAAMHVNVARMFFEQGRYEDADDSLRRGEEIFRELDFQIEMGVAHLAHGYMLSRTGDLVGARKHLIGALEVFEPTGNRINHAYALVELGRLERLDNRRDRAASLLQDAIDVLPDDGDVRVLAAANRELGLCYAPSDTALAEKYLRIALDLYTRAEELVEVGATWGALGDIFKKAGRNEAACEAYFSGLRAMSPSLL